MTEKTVDYYMSLPYPVRIYPEPDGSGYTAEIPDLPGCLTCADTLPELWEMIEDAKRTWIEGSLEAGLPIPEPAISFANQSSGKLTLRLPRSLHRRIAEQAEREGVSINQFITAALAQTVGTLQQR
jgi:antitoxin HicB